MKFEGRWFWCDMCECASIKCEHCGNISCSGGGCDLCHDDFEEAIHMKNPPPKEELPVRNLRSDIDKLLGGSKLP